jgi:D-alanyl-D-alanine carboxypeptidase/D-alanyl-D-alanine-endopeptidase (penicillin-binding protein 4)
VLAPLLLAACASEQASAPETAASAAAPKPRVQSVQKPPAPAVAKPAKRIARSRFDGRQVGYVVRDLDTGRVVTARNPDRTFIPASVTKLVTGIAALETLGGDHRFVTRVASDSRVADGTVRGDVILMGGSNPLLQSRDLMGLCQRLAHKGITGVAGRLVVDDSGGLRRRAISRNQPPDAAYNPALSPLSINFNRLRLVHRLGASGEAAVTYSVPPLPGVSLDVGADRPTAARGNWQPEVKRKRVVWKLNPAVDAAGETWVPLKRPARAAGSILRRLCKTAGVTLPAARPGNAPAKARTLARHESRRLSAIVAAMFRYSNNLVAESLGGATARAMTGQRLSLAQSAAAVNQWWRQELPEVQWRGFATRNHSGLTAAGRASPAQIAAILAYAADRTYATRAGAQTGIHGLLPMAGDPDAFGDRLQSPTSALRVWGKTGTMHYASGFAGYLRTTSGRNLAFSIFVTDRQGRQRYDARPAPQKGASAATQRWRDAAKALEADLVRFWLQRL